MMGKGLWWGGGDRWTGKAHGDEGGVRVMGEGSGCPEGEVVKREG